MNITEILEAFERRAIQKERKPQEPRDVVSADAALESMSRDLRLAGGDRRGVEIFAHRGPARARKAAR